MNREDIYKSLDWTQPDVLLAKQVGVSRSVIFAWRRRLGKKRVPRRTATAHQQLLRQARGWNWKASVAQLAAEHQISREWVYRIASKIGRRAGTRSRR